jgi:zinc transport system permease protein
MILAAALCLLFTVGGIAISYGPELPAGATVIQLAGAAYLLALLGKWAFRRFRGSDEPRGSAMADEGEAL